MPRHAAILFDLDGTLVDSAEAIRGGLRSSLAALGLPARPEAELTACIGLPLPHVWDRLGVPGDRHAEAAAGYRAWADAGGQPPRPFAGVDALIAALRAAGGTLVLASAKDTASARRALVRHGWDGLFSGCSGAEPGDGPDKRGIVARGLAGLPPELRRDAVMVGDMPVDGDAAAAAGIPFAACAYGFGVPAELAAQRPVFTAPSVAALAGWLLG